MPSISFSVFFNLDVFWVGWTRGRGCERFMVVREGLGGVRMRAGQCGE